MKIIRDGKEIELTDREMLEAHDQVAKGFMAGILMGDFGLDREKARFVAEKAYDKYCEGNGETEYECIQWAYKQYISDASKKGKLVVVSDILWDVDEAHKTLLPEEVILPSNFARENFEDEGEQCDAIMDYLSEVYGATMNSFVTNEEKKL